MPSSPSSHPDLAARVAAHGEWITGFTIDGVKYGGHYEPDHDDRAWKFVAHLRAKHPGAAHILECGCLEGGHTRILAREFPQATIHAVDVRRENLAKARLLTELTGCRNVTFLEDDFEHPRAALARPYDAIFCVGLLYHLRRPELFLKLACAASPVLWLWTVYCAEEAATNASDQARGRGLFEATAHPLSAVRDESFLPTLGTLMEYLWAAGYTNVNLIRKEMTANGNGPAIFLCAER